MSALFHKESTYMFGFDSHPLDSDAPVPHLVGTAFSHFANNGGRTSNVFADGESMIHEGYTLMLVPHVAVPETQLGLARLGATNASSDSKATLAVHSVTGNGAALACAASGRWGLNVNCNAPIKLPTGDTVTNGTVFTQPTAEDFAMASISYAWSVAWSLLMKQVFKKAVDPLTKDWNDYSRMMSKSVQSYWSKFGKSAFEKIANPVELLRPYVHEALQ